MECAIDDAAFIVGGGPSVAGFDLEILRSAHVIAVNNSWEIVPWAEILFFRDHRWWDQKRFNNGERVLRTFKGRIATVSKHCKDKRLEYWDYAPNAASLAGKTTLLGADSGTCAISLAWRLGFKAIFLVGFDLAPDGAKTHWHAGHPEPTRPNEWERFAPLQETLAKVLEKKGVLLRRLTEPGSPTIPVTTVAKVKEMGYLA